MKGTVLFMSCLPKEIREIIGMICMGLIYLICIWIFIASLISFWKLYLSIIILAAFVALIEIMNDKEELIEKIRQMKND